MKPLNQVEIKEIAEQMDCGMRCFHNSKTDKLLFFPADLDFDSDTAEFWQAEIDELENNISDYKEIEKPDGRDSFKIMEEFANSNLINAIFKNKLLDVLQLKNPFANFKIIIDNSDYREEWFSFKNNWMQQWVKEQLEIDLENEK